MPRSERTAQSEGRARRDRGGEGKAGARRRVAILLAAVIVVAVAGIAWRSVDTLPSTDGALGRLEDRLVAVWLQTRADQLLAPSDDSTPVEFEVAAGESLERIANRLAAEGLIVEANTFVLYARVLGLDRQVQAGSHTLRRNMTAGEVLEELQLAAAASVTVTTLEGWRSEQIAGAVAAAGLCDTEEFLAAVRSGASTQLPPDLPEGASLEGYLYPDTYQFDEEAGSDAVLAKLVGTFNERFTPAMRDRAREQGLSIHEAVTLASIVEREATVAEERPRIARVFLNRLAEPPYLLNADPTVQYALGYQPEEQTWWKRSLTVDDLAVMSPYNTYEVAGLPPGPIASPGMASIEAVLEPEDGTWMYFVANDLACDGSHVFADDWESHLDNVATYRTGSCGRD